MDLYTSYWTNRNLAGADAIPIVISRISLPALTHKKVPYRYKMLRLLQPSRETFALYRSSKIEQPGELCHRRLWADRWREKTGQEVPELPLHPTAYSPEPGFR